MPLPTKCLVVRHRRMVPIMQDVFGPDWKVVVGGEVVGYHFDVIVITTAITGEDLERLESRLTAGGQFHYL